VCAPMRSSARASMLYPSSMLRYRENKFTGDDGAVLTLYPPGLTAAALTAAVSDCLPVVYPCTSDASDCLPKVYPCTAAVSDCLPVVYPCTADASDCLPIVYPCTAAASDCLPVVYPYTAAAAAGCLPTVCATCTLAAAAAAATAAALVARRPFAPPAPAPAHVATRRRRGGVAVETLLGLPAGIPTAAAAAVATAADCFLIPYPPRTSPAGLPGLVGEEDARRAPPEVLIPRLFAAAAAAAVAATARAVATAAAAAANLSTVCFAAPDLGRPVKPTGCVLVLVLVLIAGAVTDSAVVVDTGDIVAAAVEAAWITPPSPLVAWDCDDTASGNDRAARLLAPTAAAAATAAVRIDAATDTCAAACDLYFCSTWRALRPPLSPPSLAVCP
jgi:hypothetical protein